MKITVTHDDGTTQDITRLVQIAYDVATHSMDWGSGFLDIEETDGLILLSEACRFPDCEEKIAEVWRDRLGKMPAFNDWNKMQEEAHRRGVEYWYGIKPTAEEREGFLAEAKERHCDST